MITVYQTLKRYFVGIISVLIVTAYPVQPHPAIIKAHEPVLTISPLLMATGLSMSVLSFGLNSFAFQKNNGVFDSKYDLKLQILRNLILPVVPSALVAPMSCLSSLSYTWLRKHPLSVTTAACGLSLIHTCTQEYADELMEKQDYSVLGLSQTYGSLSVGIVAQYMSAVMAQSFCTTSSSLWQQRCYTHLLPLVMQVSMGYVYGKRTAIWNGVKELPATLVTKAEAAKTICTRLSAIQLDGATLKKYGLPLIGLCGALGLGYIAHTSPTLRISYSL